MCPIMIEKFKYWIIYAEMKCSYTIMINHQKFQNLIPCESNKFFLYQHDLLNHVQFSEIKERLNVPSHIPRKRDVK